MDTRVGRIAVVLGTRPEIIKLGPVVAALPEAPVIIHTGQHYDSNMSEVFLDTFGLGEPDHRIDIGGSSRGRQIGVAVSELDHLFADLDPVCVVIQGDTNTTAAAAMAANARSIPLVHVEAGLRSRDRRMPEEHNRVIADHLSDLCLAPTQRSAQNLRSEGIDEERIRVTGNTIVDALHLMMTSREERARVLHSHGLESDGFVLSTFHRPENVDDPDNLGTILHELGSIGLPVVLPAHPRTHAILEQAGLTNSDRDVRLLPPLAYGDFLSLLADCRLAVSDSGGVQEEVSVLKRPMVVVRNSTERPEVLGTFCTLVSVGSDISASAWAWLDDEPYALEDLAAMESPYGEGDSGKRCATQILELVEHPV